ncbi:MAG: DUF4398 domain-containing protein [Methylobacter sp.]
MNKRFSPMILSAAVMVSACSSMPRNPSLTDAHNNYDSALRNPQVAFLAAPELKVAENALDRADQALNANESDDTVDHLAYLARQQAAIAEATAEWKQAELAVVNAAIKRILARRLIKTAESDKK